ncbi:MAG: malto-oligosyltrehalose synthase [Ignavibacteria bacterium]|jgi:(1->4)-alpha-D-glucan 1-alpha-D-glucosylmutase|nr:malto-oligosyltrehalose synthase [Ignavibacteria bacterium]MCU7503590.1 malto-oligosyltrehalose synthase [Ignavibacteria bacterium]MCU7516756.1 malto-oligosyltrehalose synthase [Ignavibacteria bacterium]
MHIPRSTYRLQLNADFTFNDLKEIVRYLSELGISDIYSSPIMKAAKGSLHGYDSVDPNQFNSEIGTEEEFDQLVEEYKKYKMGWLQDVVPNHMAYSSENQMIVDLLENGPNSRFYNFFDIEWNHPHASVRQRVLAPFLGKYFQEVLEDGELMLRYDAEGFSVYYYDNRFPLKMESYSDILAFRMPNLQNKLGKNHPDVIKYLAVLYILRSLPTSEEMDERYSQIKFVKGMLYELYTGNEVIREFIDENLRVYNGRKGVPESFNMLEKLLADQYFRLAYWKVANEEINYRRFFNISSLISLKMENEEVFNRIHTLVLKLVGEGKIDGLRIDHVDGLYDPTSYLKRLRGRLQDNYLVVEKILELEEELPAEWPIEGTTGYEFVNYVNGIFIKKENEKALTDIYQKFSGFTAPYERVVAEKKRLIIQTRMAGEVERLAFLVEAVSSIDRYGIDITMHGLKRALEEILTYFPIYRTYINASDYTERDKSYLEDLFRRVSRISPRLSHEFNYICNLLMLSFREHFTEEQKKIALDFVMKFQQLTGPLMAKGFEDTALYVFNRLISLNEVGGNAGRFGISADEFHNYCQKRAAVWPYSMNATATHDTKRGEDVRARINVLSEIPGEWEERVNAWNKMTSPGKGTLNGEAIPDRNDEYFLYQTLIGSFPFEQTDTSEYIGRIKEYVIKAIREAKVHTAWIKPDEDYEQAYSSFVENILTPSDGNHFLMDFTSFQKKIAFYGMLNSLSQTMIKLTSTGVPDVYQGTELWDLSLVDPDNRRPVDFDLRRNLLEEIKAHSEKDRLKYLANILNSMQDGRIKMYLMHYLLKARNENKDLFLDGQYIPLNPGGSHGRNLIAFARKLNHRWSVSVAPRLLTEFVKEGELPLGERWAETMLELPPEIKSWRNALTGSSLKMPEKPRSRNYLMIKDVLSNFPVALLLGEKT